MGWFLNEGGMIFCEELLEKAKDSGYQDGEKYRVMWNNTFGRTH